MTSSDAASPGQTAHVQTWQTLAEFDLSGEPGGEDRMAERIAEAVRGLEWPAAHLKRLKLALVRTMLNAIEHSRVHDSEASPVIRVLIPQSSRPARATDQPCAESTQLPATARPAQHSRQTPSRGWGFFLIEKTVQSPGRHDVRHLIELYLYPEGETRDPNNR
jgi:anti-sigma regulatory factor (Ser/Thr protein kinase)